MGLGRARGAVHAHVLRCDSIWQSSGSPRNGYRRLCHEWTSSGASSDPALACLVSFDYTYSLFVKLRKFGRVCNIYGSLSPVPRLFYTSHCLTLVFHSIFSESITFVYRLSYLGVFWCVQSASSFFYPFISLTVLVSEVN